MVAGCGGTRVYRVYGSWLWTEYLLCTLCVCVVSVLGFGCNITSLGSSLNRQESRLVWRKECGLQVIR